MLELRFDISDSLNEGLTLQLAPFYRGEKGQPGAPFIEIVAQNAVGGGRVVLFDEDLVIYATNQVLTHRFKIVGITNNSASVGDNLVITMTGRIEDESWNWDVNLPIFLGVNGLLTQTPPQYPIAAFSLIVGFPLSPTEIYFSLREPIALGE